MASTIVGFGMASIIVGLLRVVYVVICLFLILIVLLQKGEGGGLAGAFGGMGGESAFGVKGDRTFKKLTAIIGALFMILAVFLGAMIERSQRGATTGGTEGTTIGGTEEPGETGEGTTPGTPDDSGR